MSVLLPRLDMLRGQALLMQLYRACGCERMEFETNAKRTFALFVLGRLRYESGKPYEPKT